MSATTQSNVVFVGLSGGVDSAVAAARLKHNGYTVVGVFIKVWHPDFMVCNWEQERLDAMRVAAHLKIPFLTCDAEAAYRDDVAHYFIEEYRAGRTPNPDVMCNQHVKFGRFLEFAKEKGADFIATGHYAQRIKCDESFELHRGIDQDKDQTYFLWTLSNEQLSNVLFPIGDTPKSEIRKEAVKFGLPVATKKDSQGVCFLGHVDIPDFLSHYINLQPGTVLNETGQEIGTHKGALVYTLGQRHGFTINTTDQQREPHFVIEKRVTDNILVVATKQATATKQETITLQQVVLRNIIAAGDTLEVQTRYRQKPFTVTVTSYYENTVTIQLDTIIDQPAPGQSCVLYRGSLCLGGGIVS